MVMVWGQVKESKKSGTQVAAFSVMQNQLMAALKVVWSTCTKFMDSSFLILSTLKTHAACLAILASRLFNLHTETLYGLNHLG